MRKQRWLAAALAALALAGCGRREQAPPQPAGAPEPQGSSAVEPAQEAGDASQAPAEGGDAQSIPVHPTERGFRWSGDGRHLIIRQGNTLQYIGLDNEVEREVSFPFGEPKEGPDSGRFYSWDAHHMLVTRTGSGPAEETRVEERDGGLTLTNAAIFSIDGALIREFPPPASPLREEDLEPYEKSIRQNVGEVVWLNEDQFAVDLKAKVYLYSISLDRLELVHDMTQAVREGYSIFDSGAYGSNGLWGWDGVYYYSACPEVPADQKPRYALYAADMENGARVIMPEIPYGDGLYMRDGKLMHVASPAVQNPADPDDFIYDITVRAADLPGLDFRELARYQSANHLPYWDGTHYIYDTVEDGRHIYHILGQQTGEETTFCPGDLDDTGRRDDPYAYGLMAVLPGENGSRYLHSRYDVQETIENGETHYYGYNYFYLYDEATGENRLLTGGELGWSEWPDDPVSPSRTHYVDGLDEVRVLPFD